MNYWSELSIQLANQRNYLDELYTVYPLAPDVVRDINATHWNNVESAFKKRDNKELIKNLLRLDLFPLKDSYVAYLRHDKASIDRNPDTVNRLCGRLYEMGLEKIWARSSEPKETNRQIGPLFKRWLDKKTLGLDVLRPLAFTGTDTNAILDGSDAELMSFAQMHLNYNGTKGLDFVARIHGKYVVGEAKFLTDFGGHQYAQLEDAKILLSNSTVKAIKVGILDGVLYIKGENKMHQYVATHTEQYNIFSSLLLREFLYSIN
jgi:hypothetical protein